MNFNISTILIITLLVAIVLGVSQIHVGLSIGLAIIVTPALIRAGWIVERERSLGRRFNATEKTALFFGSVGIVLAIGLSAGAALLAACFGGGFAVMALGEMAQLRLHGAMNLAVLSGFILGGTAGLVTAILMIKRLWWRKQIR